MSDKTLFDLRPTQVKPVKLGQIQALSGMVEPRWEQVEVTGVSVDSQDLAPGEIFVAIGGKKAHGATFAAGAIENGAVAIVTDAAGAGQINEQIPVVVVPDPRALAGIIAAEVYDHPDQKLRTFAVTGTNGKTTTTFMLRAMLAAAGHDVALVGSVEMKVGDLRVPSVHTTTEAPVSLRILALAAEKGLDCAIIEASSHALTLHRLAGITFDVAGFTNLQPEHLDFHHTMEEYFQAKASLFTPHYSHAGVVCVDDEWGQKLVKTASIPVTSVSSKGGASDIQVVSSSYDTAAHKQVFQVKGRGLDGSYVSMFPGPFNVQNAMVALAMAAQAGVSAAEIRRGLQGASPVPGRMQTVRAHCPAPLVIVDYAHTPEALENSLKACQALTSGKIHLVFGSDGDRDKTKRPLLGEIGARLADVLWLTDENPRTEVPQQIRAEIKAGIRRVRPDLHDVTEVTTSRRDALRMAILRAAPEDLVIVTGKGAEPYQEVENVYHRYSDVETAQESLDALARKGAGTAK